ncbi:hypothetical protein [Desulfotomaculum sp. 1211_IL3151]|uniref:hypothetical protein n=1 Tax=Desulfotomaculum sp. 1211_IL3151 TaxID=3084055 RepID=UPI002FDB7DFA
MRLIEKLMQLNGKTEEQSWYDCPFNYEQIKVDSFVAYCDEGGSGCEWCHNQEIDD